MHTKPRREKAVAAYFQERLGLETYFPRLRQKKTIRRIKRVVTRPLFPRYLFTRLELSSHFRAVRYAPDVVEVVSFGAKPSVVEDSLIGELRRWAGESIDVLTLQPELKVGDEVDITDGPMSGLSATILHINSDSERVAVLLSVLECGAKVIINRAQLSSML
jgi:transcriptional antiterminator RfaH